MAQEFVLHGYDEFLRACARAGPEAERAAKEVLRRVAEDVRALASSKFQRFDPVTASGFRVLERSSGIGVEQTISATTGLRPDFGSLQMREALIPARSENLDRLDREMDKALGRVADHFERG